MPNAISVYTLTLTLANTNYRLSTLISDIDPKERQAFSEIRIAASDGIDGVGSNTADVLVGDSNLSTTRFFLSLQPGEEHAERGGDGGGAVSTNSIYLRSASAGQKINFYGRLS